MKRVCFVFFLLLSVKCSSLEKEELIQRFYAMDTPTSVEKTCNLAFENIPIVEAILKDPMGSHHARVNAFSVLLAASRQGKLEKAAYFAFVFNQLEKLSIYSSRNSLEKERRTFVTLLSEYSFVPCLGKGVPIAENFRNSLLMISVLWQQPNVNWHKPAKELDLLEKGRTDFEKGDVTKAVSLVKAAIDLISLRLRGAEDTRLVVINGHLKNLVLQILASRPPRKR